MLSGRAFTRGPFGALLVALSILANCVAHFAAAAEAEIEVAGPRGPLRAALLARSNSAAKLVIVPRTNHVLKEVASSDRAANLATYADPKLPLAQGFVEGVAAFLLADPSR